MFRPSGSAWSARRPLPIFVLGLLALVALAGCSDAPDQAPTDTIRGPAREPGPLPVQQKMEFTAVAPATLPLVMPTGPAATFDIGGADRLLVALDLAGGPNPLTLRIVAPSGSAVYDAQADAGKLVFEPDAEAGTYSVFAESTSAWDLGLVVTSFPTGFDEGTRVQVSFPEQDQIEHAFRPARIEAPADQDVRLTLYDFDPHAGIRNLQHNLHFPTLGLRTEGKTTWGEVRVLDLPPLAPGDYAFQCEFHGFTGTLAIA